MNSGCDNTARAKKFAVWNYAVVAALVLIAWAPWIAAGAQTQCFIGPYADPMHSDVNTFSSGPGYSMVDVWVWVRPSDVGLQALEFSLEYPQLVFPTTLYINPDIVVTLGDPQIGLSAAFGPCQMDWVWICRQVVLVTSASSSGYVMVKGNPMAAPYFLQYGSCETGFPIHPMQAVNYLAINQCAYMCGCWPRIQTVQPLTYSKLQVDFGTCVWTSGDPYTDHFHLFADGSTVETIHVIESQRISDGVFILTLDGPMSDGTRYVLVAQEIPNCEIGCPWIESSSRGFLFDVAIATLLQRHDASVVDGAVELEWMLSAVDPDARFFVLRSADGGAFEALAGEPSEIAPLSYRYVDAMVEPGRRYAYRVEYSTGDTRELLFASDEIAVPAADLALHQNVPNPFNPSTAISFTLPEPCAVTLEIYDVSGRLVARLLNGQPLPAGARSIEWNGRDGGGGNLPSGIYFCRLVSGKERLTRKMVLLR